MCSSTCAYYQHTLANILIVYSLRPVRFAPQYTRAELFQSRATYGAALVAVCKRHEKILFNIFVSRSCIYGLYIVIYTHYEWRVCSTVVFALVCIDFRHPRNKLMEQLMSAWSLNNICVIRSTFDVDELNKCFLRWLKISSGLMIYLPRLLIYLCFHVKFLVVLRNINF